MIGIANAIGQKVGSGGIDWTAYWATHLFDQEDLDFWVKKDSRSGLTLTDSVNVANNPSILLPYISPVNTYQFASVNTGITAAANTIMVFKGMANVTDTDAFGCDTFNFQIYNYAPRRYVLFWGDTIGHSGATLADSNWHIFICYDKRVWVCDPATELTDASILDIIATVTPTVNVSTASWVAPSGELKLLINTTEIVACKMSMDKCFIGTITAGVITWQKKYILNNPYVALDLLSEAGNTLITNRLGELNNTLPLVRYSDAGDNRCLEVGYTLCKKDTYQDISVPYLVSGSPVVSPTMPTGYVPIRNYATDPLNHNLADSKIRFAAGSIWDRSSATVWKAGARGGYYDASNPTDWHISELNQLQMYNWLNTDYLGRPFVKVDPNSVDADERLKLEELFSYATNKTGDDLSNVLRYTDDYSLIII